MKDGNEEASEPRASKHEGPDRSSPYPVSRLSGPVSLVDVAREIERADHWIASTSSAKLEQIASQMRLLREQAEQVLRDAQQNAELHRAEARFVRHPGKVYHLYERAGGKRYWSMLSPNDWGGSAPHGYVGSYRLEGDQSWTPLERVLERDRERGPLLAQLHHLMSRGSSSALPSAVDLTLASQSVRLDSTPAHPSGRFNSTPAHPSASVDARLEGERVHSSSSEKEATCESSSSPPSDRTDRG